jgi:hypothetical protein
MKRRQPFTVEAAILRIFEKLGTNQAAQIVGKSESLLRKASDPDNPFCISVRDAILLDHNYALAGHGEPPIAAAYTEILTVMEASMEKNIGNISPLESLAMIMEEVGEVARDTNEATRDGRITNNEVAKAAQSIDDAIESLFILKRSITPN